MAESSMAIDSGNITTFADDTQNSVSDINTTFTEIVDKFNAALETATGHDHDGSNSKSVSSGIAGLTIEEYTLAAIMGGYV